MIRTTSELSKFKLSTGRDYPLEDKYHELGEAHVLLVGKFQDALAEIKRLDLIIKNYENLKAENFRLNEKLYQYGIK